jgi:hypothetical protein
VSVRPDLRVLDGDGEVTIRDDLTALPSDEAALVEVIVKQRREIAALKRDAAKMAAVDPDAETISELLEYWRDKTGHAKARIPVDGRRWRIVKARLKDGFEADRLKRAIDGVVAFPFEGDYGERFTEPGPGRKRKDDIVNAMRDEELTERRIRLAEGDGPMREYRRFVFDACRQHPSLVDGLALLGGQVPDGNVLARAVVWARKETERKAER